MRDQPFIAVAGGANIDIGGKSFAKAIPHDSNPGTVTVSPGGVARNIAHNLALLQVPVELFTVRGDDLYGALLADSCKAGGIMLHAKTIDGASTSTYLYIADADGDMTCAVSDMAICDYMTPGYFREHLETINRAKAFVMDTNLPEESLAYLAREATVPVFADTVSVTKAKRLQSILPNIHTLKPNRMEAELLTGIRVESKTDAARAADALLEKGVKNVFLTLGTDGVLCACKDGKQHIPATGQTAVSFTGAGDAFTAGLLYAFYHAHTFEEAGRIASAAAAAAAASKETINKNLSPDLLQNSLKTEVLT